MNKKQYLNESIERKIDVIMFLNSLNRDQNFEVSKCYNRIFYKCLASLIPLFKYY